MRKYALFFTSNAFNICTAKGRHIEEEDRQLLPLRLLHIPSLATTLHAFACYLIINGGRRRAAGGGGGVAALLPRLPYRHHQCNVILRLSMY